MTEATSVSGRLILVGMPIGNVLDLSPRAIQTLQQVDVILAEDTRKTKAITDVLGIASQLKVFNDQSDTSRVEHFIELLLAGQDLALVSDAGMPVTADPGSDLVAAAREHDIEVDVIPGPSAVSAALALSGLSGNSFQFLGYIAKAPKARNRQLQLLVSAEVTSICFESPRRLKTLLEDLSELIGPTRTVVLCKEITKSYQAVLQGTALELLQKFEDQDQDNQKGEFTLVIGASTDARAMTKVTAMSMSGEELPFSEDEFISAISALAPPKVLAKWLVSSSLTTSNVDAVYRQIVASKGSDN